MTEILKEISKELPKDADVSDISFEGANIVIYTKNREFFANNNGTIKGIVDKIKKRVELRADPSILLDEEKTEEKPKYAPKLTESRLKDVSWSLDILDMKRK